MHLARCGHLRRKSGCRINSLSGSGKRASDNGAAYEYFWPNSPFFEHVLSRGFSVIAVIAFTNLFVWRFIELLRLRPHWYRRLNIMQLGIATMMLVSMGATQLCD